MSKENDGAVREDGVEEEIPEESKEDLEDDGRTVADMSGIGERASFFGSITGFRGERKRRRDNESPDGNAEKKDRVDMTRKEKRWFIFGALGAALLIALAFAVGIGLIILLMVLVW